MEQIKRRILYVDDHDDTRELMSLVLNQRGFEVTTASSYITGTELCKTQNFDLYLLDFRLPDGDGLELCRSIREAHPLALIMFLSAAVYDRDRENALDSGAQAYLTKPTLPSELCSAIELLFEYEELRSAPMSEWAN